MGAEGGVEIDTGSSEIHHWPIVFLASHLCRTSAFLWSSLQTSLCGRFKSAEMSTCQHANFVLAGWGCAR